MEEAAGRQLGEVWEDMDLDSKVKIVEDVVAIERKFLSLSFTRFVMSKYFRGYDSANAANTGNLVMEVSTSRSTLFRAAKRSKLWEIYHSRIGRR